MRATTVALSAFLAVLLLLPASAPASAFDEITGVTMSFSPREMSGGAPTHMVVTLTNSNNRSLVITTLTVQIYEGMMWGSMDKYVMYHINPTDAVVPAGGSKDFAIDGNAPNYMGYCSVMVTIGGIFDGDENASVGLLSSSTEITPGMGMFTMGLGLVLLVIVGIFVAVAVLVIIIFGKKGRTTSQYRPVCPTCGTPVVPGSMFCTRCGRKLQ